MSDLDEKSFENHKHCTSGDTVIATDREGNEYMGTVVNTPGATVYVQSNTGEVLEFRRVREDDTGDPVILLAIDAKDVEHHDPEHGVNTDGIPITKETTTLSFDTRIIDFEAEDQELVIG